MQLAVRPYLTTGVALVGASVLAVAPIAVKPSEIEVPALSTAAVDLMANPVDFYTQVIQRTVDNAGALAEIFLENPAPIFRQVLANQLANLEELVDALVLAGEGISTALTEEVPVLLQTAFDDLSNGNVEGALNTLLSVPLTFALPLLNVVGALITPITEATANFNNVVQNVLAGVILGGALAVAGPVISTIGSVGTAIQSVIDAAAAGDPVEIVNAFINAPGVFADAFLNGGYGPLFLGLLPAPGFLTPEGLLGVLGAGPVGFLLAVRQAIADAITPVAEATLRQAPESQSPAAADTLVDDEATIVSLDVSVGTGSGPTGDPIPTDDAVTDDTVTDESEEAAGEEDSEESTETTEDTTEDGADEGAEDGSDPVTGGTDLSDGNKVTPADSTPADEAPGDGSNGDPTDPGEENTADAEASGANDAGGDDAGGDTA